MKKQFSQFLYYRKSHYKLNRLSLRVSDPEISKHYDDFRCQNYKDLALPSAILGTLYLTWRVIAMFLKEEHPSTLVDPALGVLWAILNLFVVKIAPKRAPYMIHLLLLI